MNEFRLALAIVFFVSFKICLAQPGNFEIDESKVENCVPKTEIPIELYENIIDAEAKKGGRLNRSGSYTIPVVFHIIHKGGPENISDDQVFNALEMLNQDFSATNADIVAVPDTFKNIIGNANINFQLAQQAPDGSCTNGINRYFSPYSEEWDYYWTDDGQYFLDDIKKTFFWDVDKYLNIYVVNSSRNSGIAYFPYQVEAEINANKWLDGIMMRHYNLGSIGTAEDNYLPHVFAHEAGHYFNLLHAWGNWWYPGSSQLDWYDDCEQLDENCPDFYCSSDDLVDDTPNCKGYNYYLCPNNLLNTCVDAENDLPDNTQNMMDYSCMVMFTEGQVERMQNSLNSNIAQRSNLWSEENLDYTLNCSGAVATQNCYQIYSSYIRGFDVVAENYGYLMTTVYNTNIKARYKINDGDWVNLPETDRYYFALTDIQKCSKYQFQISEKCGEVFSPWTANRFFFTNGEEVPVAIKTQFYTVVEKQDETAFNANDAYIEINTINGTAPFTFNWSTGDTTSTLNNIEPGKYYVSVSDSSGCTVNDTIVIERLYCDSLNVEINHSNQSYFNSADGNIEVIADGGILPYSYLWSTGETSNQIDSLLPGEYWFVLTDSFQCKITDTVKIDTVDCSSLNVVFDISNETDFEAYNGFIEAEVSGGIPPYNYYWSANDTTISIDSLSTGNYTFMAIDSIGCEVLDTLIIEAQYCNNLAIDVLTTNLSYNYANDATALVTAIGGKAPYSFSWSTGDTLALIDSLSAGNYSIEITDSNLCTAALAFDVYKYDCDNFKVNFNTTYINYLDSNDGAIQITTHNGYEPLQILWSTGDTLNKISNLYAGDYSVEIIDSTGCIYTDTLAISNVNCDSLKLNITTTNQTYFNYNNGSILIEVENGIMPFNINWNNGENTLQLDSLSPDIYNFYFEDAVGCVAIDTIFIAPIVCDSLNVTVDILEESFVGANDATANATVVNGVLPVQYNWSTGDTTSIINSLNIGDYILNISDAVGCEITDSITIRNSYCDSLIVDVLTTNLTDSNANDATALAIISGGETPYTYIWSTGDTLVNIPNLSAGTYYVEVLDSNLCSTTTSFEIYNYDCNNFKTNFNITYINYINSNDGAIQLTAHNGYEPLQILWSTGDTIERIENLYEGDYSVQVTDSIGCVYIDTLYVANINCDSLQLNITKTDQTYYNQSGGSISIEVSNGIMPFNINWNNGSNALQLNNLSPGPYSFYFEDAVGCIAADTIFILPIICDDFDIIVEIEEESFAGANDASANAIAINGTPPFNYYWSTGEQTNIITNLEPAAYQLNVYDANGCYANDTITIAPFNCNAFNFEVTVHNETYFNAKDGTATITAENVNTAYQIYWSTGDTAATVTNLQPGVYYYLISANNGCSISDSIVINEIDCSQFSVNVQIENDKCSGNNNGSLQLIEFENAVKPVQYFWNNDTLLNDSLLTGLSSGYYLFDAIDSVGCSFNAAYRVANETEILIETYITPESWQGSNDGSIETFITGGTPPYVYNWSTNDTTNSITNLIEGMYNLTVTDANNCRAMVENILIEPLVLCPESSVLNNNENLSSKTYQVTNFIESNASINIGENIFFKAGNFISLNNGFAVPKGADFSIEIGACE